MCCIFTTTLQELVTSKLFCHIRLKRKTLLHSLHGAALCSRISGILCVLTFVWGDELQLLLYSPLYSTQRKEMYQFQCMQRTVKNERHGLSTLWRQNKEWESYEEERWPIIRDNSAVGWCTCSARSLNGRETFGPCDNYTLIWICDVM